MLLYIQDSDSRGEWACLWRGRMIDGRPWHVTLPEDSRSRSRLFTAPAHRLCAGAVKSQAYFGYFRRSVTCQGRPSITFSHHRNAHSPDSSIIDSTVSTGIKNVRPAYRSSRYDAEFNGLIKKNFFFFFNRVNPRFKYSPLRPRTRGRSKLMETD